MVRLRHAPLIRFCLAALIAFALMLNGMNSVAMSAESDDTGGTVIIAGTVVTLCQFGKDVDTKGHHGHSCDQCALRLAVLLQQIDADAAALQFPRVLALQSLSSRPPSARSTRSPAWPRGPPAA